MRVLVPAIIEVSNRAECRGMAQFHMLTRDENADLSMPRNEEGEFELILGNRQLLSVFFLVVILLGVFFTMGYIVGRNAGPVGAAETASATRPRSEAPQEPLTIRPREETTPSPKEPASLRRPVESLPAPSESTAAPVKHADVTPKPVESPKPTVTTKAQELPKPVVTARPAPAAERVVEVAPRGSNVMEPIAGQTYLQVAAVARSEAEVFADVLRQRGFKAHVAVGPNDKIFRVVVGPLANTADIAKTRTDLDAAGFKSLVKKY